jgi:hypothetical protein
MPVFMSLGGYQTIPCSVFRIWRMCPQTS